MVLWFGREEKHGLASDLSRARRAISLQTREAVRHFRVARNNISLSAKKVDERVCKEIATLARRSGLRVTDEYVRGALHSMFTAGVAVVTLMSITRGTHRIRQAKDLPNRLIGSGRDFKGWVARVGDGDGLRVRHAPAIRLPFVAKRAAPRSRAADTISIRLAGVDAPECAHFGKPGQAFGNDAREWLERFVVGRHVRVVVHAVDQYNRAVASVFRSRSFLPLPFGERNVSVELARAGYATMYEASGAQYGGARHQLERAILSAQRARRGMWSAKSKLETPAEFKRRLRTGSRALPNQSNPMKQNISSSIQSSEGFHDFLKTGRRLYSFLRKFR